MPLVNKCLACDKVINLEKEKEISCDSCKLPIHSLCSGLSRTEIQSLTNKDRRILYHCDKCMSLRSEVMELKQLILDLKAELENIERQNLLTSSSSDCENLIQEINERQRRANNIILFNIEESTSANSQDQIDHDLNKAVNIVGAVNVITTGIKAFRLGRTRVSGKMRPLKVILNNPSGALVVLKSKLVLKETFPGISISDDQTTMQRNHLQKLRTELQDRLSSGEKDITIRYIHGIPKIVPVRK
uniref:PHD-type domain-containing protein n=1 Tax=Photinus pyralis TaxID=7054 RepID=A0A1Y1MPT1_PHOPY